VNIEKELRDAILGMSAVTGLVVARIWDEWFRTETLPAVVYEFDNEDQSNDLEGLSRLRIADINIICRADTRAGSRALAEAMRLNGTNPGTGLAGYTSTTFDAWLESEQAAAVPKIEGGNDYWYDTNMSFRLQWTEVA